MQINDDLRAKIAHDLTMKVLEEAKTSDKNTEQLAVDLVGDYKRVFVTIRPLFEDK